MTTWEYNWITVAQGESHYDVLRSNGANGWEAWHIQPDDRGWRVIYFKRPKLEIVRSRCAMIYMPSLREWVAANAGDATAEQCVFEPGHLGDHRTLQGKR